MNSGIEKPATTATAFETVAILAHCLSHLRTPKGSDVTLLARLLSEDNRFCKQ
jgi:hypothetical protein